MSVLSTRAGSARGGLCDLLVAYLRGDDDARDRFPIEAHEVLTRLSSHHAWFLPEDVRAEVVDEAHLILLERGGSFDPDRAPARVFLRLVVRDAVKRVAASYCPPGRRTRMSGDEAERHRLPVLSIEEQAEIGTEFCDVGAEDEIYQQCDLRSVFDHAPKVLGSALRRIYYYDESTTGVAKSIGMSRFALQRRIQAFAATCRAEHAVAA